MNRLVGLFAGAAAAIVTSAATVAADIDWSKVDQAILAPRSTAEATSSRRASPSTPRALPFRISLLDSAALGLAGQPVAGGGPAATCHTECR